MSQSLRQRALKGGTILLLRQGVSILLGLIGIFAITRIIGPEQYGLYAASYGLILFLNTLGTWGMDVYLLRKSVLAEDQEYDQAFTALLVTSGTLTALLLFGSQLVSQVALGLPQAAEYLAVLALGIPFKLLAVPAVVRLDRDLNFKQVAFNELFSQICYYLLAVPLALNGAGAWAPVSGCLLLLCIQCGLAYWSTGWRPRLRWDPPLLKDMVGYGFSYSSAQWIWQLRSLVNPLIVGRFAGAEAVAFVAIAIRMTDMLAFARDATWRLAMAALGKLGHDRQRLQAALNESLRLQALAVGLPLALFSFVAPLLIPAVFGERWNTILVVFPFIAVGSLTNCIFGLHSLVLYLLNRSWEVTLFHCLHIALFAGGALILVPQVGLKGYAWAEIGALVSYAAIHYFLSKELKSIEYSGALLWYAATLPVIATSGFDHPLHYACLLLLALPIFSGQQRSDLGKYARILLKKTGE